MKRIIIVDGSDSDIRLMSALLTRTGYEPIVVRDMEAAQQEVMKLSPGTVIVSAMKFRGDTARVLIDWLKAEGYKFHVLAAVDNLIPMEIIDVMCDWGAVNIIQRPAIDKQLVEMVDKYAKSENVMFFLDNSLIRRKSADFRCIEQSIEKIGATNANPHSKP
ncbi:MAG: response regulator [Muribaculaceae bacterium]|nr:response regulator [Muribaculaceae bacterium]